MSTRILSEEHAGNPQRTRTTFSNRSPPPDYQEYATKLNSLSRPKATHENKAQQSSVRIVTPKLTRHTIHGTSHVTRSAPSTKSLRNDDGSIVYPVSAATAKITTTHGPAGILATPTKSNGKTRKPKAVMKLETLARLSRPLQPPSECIKPLQPHVDQSQSWITPLKTKSRKTSAENVYPSPPTVIATTSEKQSPLVFPLSFQQKRPRRSSTSKASCEHSKTVEQNLIVRASGQGHTAMIPSMATVEVTEPFPIIEDEHTSILSRRSERLERIQAPTLSYVPKLDKTGGVNTKVGSFGSNQFFMQIQEVKQLSEESKILREEIETIRLSHELATVELQRKSALLFAEISARNQLQTRNAELAKECACKSEIIEALQIKADDTRISFESKLAMVNSDANRMRSMLAQSLKEQKEVAQRQRRFAELWGPESPHARNVRLIKAEAFRVRKHSAAIIAAKDEIIKETREGITRLMEEYENEAASWVESE